MRGNCRADKPVTPNFIFLFAKARVRNREEGDLHCDEPDWNKETNSSMTRRDR